MTNKVQKIREEVEKLKSQLLRGACSSQIAMETSCKEEAYNEVLSILDTMYEEPVSEELEEASKNYALNNTPWDDCKDEIQESFKAGTKWQKERLWKPADGDDLPEIDREVVVLIKYNTQRNINDEEYPTYRVGFGHRPNPDGWDGRNIDTNEVTHYTPKLYDKGGWNQPHVLYWLDAKLPYEENKITK